MKQKLTIVLVPSPAVRRGTSLTGEMLDEHGEPVASLRLGPGDSWHGPVSPGGYVVRLGGGEIAVRVDEHRPELVRLRASQSATDPERRELQRIVPLSVSFAASREVPFGSVVALDVIDGRERRVARLVVEADGWAEADVPPGDYVLRLELPTGEYGDALVHVAERERNFVQLEASPPAAPARRGPLRRLRDRLLGRRTVPAVLWSSRPDGSWERSSDLRLSRADTTSIPLSSDAPQAISYQRPGGGSEVITLPPAGSANVRVAAAEPRVQLASPLARTLSSYLEDSRLSLAATLVDPVMDEPETRLVGDSALEMLVGYYLLRTGDDERLTDWRRLPRAGADLPDELVIEGWALMRDLEFDAARDRFLHAAQVGPPAYGEGLRLLLDGLDRFAGDDRYRKDPRIGAALASMRPYASGIQLDQPLTAFPGIHPDEPEPPVPKHGAPDSVRPLIGPELTFSERRLQLLLIAHAIWAGILGIAGLVDGVTSPLAFMPNSFALAVLFLVLSAVAAADVRRNGWISIVIGIGYAALVAGQIATLAWGGAPDQELLGAELPRTGVLLGWMALTLVLIFVFVSMGTASIRAGRGLQFLHPLAFQTLVAVAEVAVPVSADLDPEQVARNVDAYLARLRGPETVRVQLALTSLCLWPLFMLRPPLPLLSPAARQRFLERQLMHAAARGFRPLRPVLQILVRVAAQLAHLGYYGDRRSWPQLGFTPPAAPGGAEPSRARSLAVPPRGGRGGYDAIVVGSGAAGAILAYRFAEAGRRVLVLERGSHVHPQALGMDEIGRYLSLYRGGALEQATNFSLRLMQADCVGGGTTVSHGLLLPPPDPVLDTWSNRGIDRAKLGHAIEETRDWLQLRGAESQSASIDAQRFARAVTTLGLQGRTMAFGEGRSVLYTVLAWAQEEFPGRLEILPECEVERIVHEGARAIAVTGRYADQARVTFQADEIAVAAGAIGSTSLLQRSGLGGDAVGHAVHFDLEAALFAEFPETVDLYAQAFVPAGDIPPFVVQSWVNPPAAQALAMPGWFDRHIDNMRRYRYIVATGVHVGTTTPGRVKTSPRGPEIEFIASAADHVRLKQGLELTAEILFAAGARRVMPATFGWHEFGSADDLASWRDSDDMLMTNAQPVGGNSLGEVVDEQFRLRGLENLYVCDASVFPTSVHVPPQLTTMALAQYASSRILVPTPAMG